MDLGVDMVDVASQLALWGEWVRVGLERPRLVGMRLGASGLGADFNEEQMMVLDRCVAALGKPTAAFLLNYYSRGWTLVVSARRAGFHLSPAGASRLHDRVLCGLALRLACNNK